MNGGCEDVKGVKEGEREVYVWKEWKVDCSLYQTENLCKHFHKRNSVAFHFEHILNLFT